ncbi:MAG: sulfate transporter, partial [Lachnospiraceae bacterium]|nr:sulfate transporter [Lachnospiraceae bacterium]
MIKRLRIRPAWTLRRYNIRNLPQDLLAGVIIAAVSIPISMGYAQIAGLPSVYGLYGSVFPILVFALLSTSPQFIFGVDAAPAAIVGAALMQLEVVPESAQAMEIVPLSTLFTAMWLLLFFFCGAGKLVNYISMPVMGGFITGICCT